MPRKKTDKPALSMTDVESEILEALAGQYTLHTGQLILDRYVFDKNFKRVFAQCGRNFGKTGWIAHSSAKWACLKAKQACYIIMPNKAQAFEVYWASGLLKSMIPERFINKNFLSRDETNKTEMRITLINGSFIKLMGADDPDALRGIKPNLCAYDEYRDFKSGVYDLMEANLLGKGATLLIGSTPPDAVGHYSELRDEFIDKIKCDHRNYAYLELPTETNPHINKEDLLDVKKRCLARGEMRFWEREYMAKFIPGGASSIFPMFSDKKHEIVQHPYMLAEIMKGMKNELEYYAFFDPATSSVFAALLIAWNRYTSQVFILDEIYERDRTKTGSEDVWKACNELKIQYQGDLKLWQNYYDEHESWFARDLERYGTLDLEQVDLSPTSKQSRDKQEDLTVIKDLMLSDKKLFISTKCPNLIEEIESYVTDKNGKIPKKKDHNIDNFRYFIAASDYSPNEEPDVDNYLEKHGGMKKAEGFEMWAKRKMQQENWETGLDESSALTDDVVYLEDLDYESIF